MGTKDREIQTLKLKLELIEKTNKVRIEIH